MSTLRHAFSKCLELPTDESSRALVREERVRGREEEALDLLVRVLRNGAGMGAAAVAAA